MDAKKPGVSAGLRLKANDRRSNHLEISSGLLAALSHDFEADLLALVQRAHTSTLNCRDVHKHILRAIVRLNEAVALLSIEKFHSSDRHQEFLSSFLLNAHAIIRVGDHKPSFWGVHLRRSPKPGARQQVRRRKRGCGRRHRRIWVERQRLTKAASVSDNVL